LGRFGAVGVGTAFVGAGSRNGLTSLADTFAVGLAAAVSTIAATVSTIAATVSAPATVSSFSFVIRIYIV
jgi:hypothetical protein